MDAGSHIGRPGRKAGDDDEVMIERHPFRGLLRGESERDHRVSSTELFFALIIVFAFTQLSHRSPTHLDAGGAF